jgi:hypothetical protein
MDDVASSYSMYDVRDAAAESPAKACLLTISPVSQQLIYTAVCNRSNVQRLWYAGYLDTGQSVCESTR